MKAPSLATQINRKQILGALAGAAMAAFLGWVLYTTAVGTKLINSSYDMAFSMRPTIARDDVAMVYMDESSHEALKQSTLKPWDRALHAQLLRRLTRDGARAVTFDIVFSDPGLDPQADDVFAAAIKENGRVVLAADNVPAEWDTGRVKSKRLLPPYEMFEQVAAEVGSAETMPDDDLMIRRHLVETRDDLIPSLSWATAKVAGVPVATNRAVQFSERWLNYCGPDGTLPQASYYKVLRDDDQGVPRGYFSNKVVFVGARIITKFAGERKDAYPTPFPFQEDQNRFMPGVEIQAMTYLNILHGDWLGRGSRTTEMSLLILFGILAGGLVFFRHFAAIGVGVLAGVMVVGGHYLLFTEALYWFPWLILIVQLQIALIWAIGFNSFQLYIQKVRLEQSLSLYLSPKRVKQFASRPDLLKPGAEKLLLTIIFTDIENFTTVSEGMDSDDLALIMNRYFETTITKCIHMTDGTVIKYIGDSIFALWNAPEKQADHSVRACEAALLLESQVVAYTKGDKSYSFHTRIGLHTGVANVGNFGSTSRIDYTAIGENINLASRMEGLNKHLGTNILITGETRAGIGDQFVVRCMGDFRLKGFERTTVTVYELLGRAAEAEATRAWREVFDAAMDKLRRRDFAGAEAGFRRVLELKPDDGPARFHLLHLAEFAKHPPGPDWRGEIEIKDK